VECCEFCNKKYKKENHPQLCNKNPGRERFFILYKTVCLTTGKFYIGVHTTYDMNDGYLGSGKILKNSVQKHGKENHVREILQEFATREEMYAAEAEMVTEDLLTDPRCMNIKPGGKGGWDFVNETGKNVAGFKNLAKGTEASARLREEWKQYSPEKFEEYCKKISNTLKQGKD
jgi:hypothetical protein